jgi:hypothetical protein
MDKKKGIILAVVLFLLIGLGTFVFANPSETDEQLSGNGNSVNSTTNGKTDDSKENA